MDNSPILEERVVDHYALVDAGPEHDAAGAVMPRLTPFTVNANRRYDGAVQPAQRRPTIANREKDSKSTTKKRPTKCGPFFRSWRAGGDGSGHWAVVVSVL